MLLLSLAALLVLSSVVLACLEATVQPNLLFFLVVIFALTLSSRITQSDQNAACLVDNGAF